MKSTSEAPRGPASDFYFRAAILTWGFPIIRGTILGIPIIRTIVYWGLYGVALFWKTTTSSKRPISSENRTILIGSLRPWVATHTLLAMVDVGGLNPELYGRNLQLYLNLKLFLRV